MRDMLLLQLTFSRQVTNDCYQTIEFTVSDIVCVRLLKLTAALMPNIFMP